MRRDRMQRDFLIELRSVLAPRLEPQAIRDPLKGEPDPRLGTRLP